jgi:TonB-dependent receptor
VKKQESRHQAAVNLVSEFVGTTIARAQDTQRSTARRLAADRSRFRLSGMRALTAPAVFLGAILSTGLQDAQAQGTDAPASTSASDKPNDGVSSEEIVVSGYRASVQSALNLKRDADVMLDAIKAEDIAKFPDSNLAESLQRLPGIAIDRDNGEGRSITVRGLGSDFTRVRLNGLETLSTGAGSDSGAAPNRSRGFDFNIFASDLFSKLEVRKTASANTDEGSLGATIDLVTARPLDYGKTKIAFSAQDAYYENGDYHNPRIAGLMADQWFDDTLGGAVSFAYSDRKSEINRYRRQPGAGDYLYCCAPYAGVPSRAGFSSPVGTNFGTAVTNPAAIDALTGSDPAAYAKLYPGAPFNTPGAFNDSTVIVPALQQIEQQNLAESRFGLTTALQWRPTDRTLVNLDGVFSRYRQKSDISQIVNIGFNRNNTNAAFNTATAATPVATKRGTYAVCTPAAASAFRVPMDCGGTEAAPGGVFAGLGTTSFSTNPHNLDPYDYYNNPGSPGYGGAAAVAAANGMYFRDKIIGRASTDVVDAHVDGSGAADYLALRNLDLRSSTDSSYFTTKFHQASLNVQQEITDSFKADIEYGRSASLNHNTAFLVEFNRPDSPDLYTYDERAHGSMPLLSYGFDVADPSYWSLVKGLSVLRHFERETDNRYDGGHINFKWQMLDPLALEFGLTHRKYEFSTTELRRPGGNVEVLNPTLQELGVTAQDLGKVYQYGAGLNAPAGTPTSFFAPDMNAFRRVIGFDCACVNKFGDWRITNLTTPGNTFSVNEADNSYFVQIDWDTALFNRRLFGNMGVRYAKTGVDSNGFTTNVAATGPRPLTAENDYSDTLPSMNVSYQLEQDLFLRAGAAKVMARPLLNNLAPSITSLTTPANFGTVGNLAIGNPQLNPFRATNYDFSAEWYFAPGALLSAAYFIKDVSNYPQSTATQDTIQSLLTPDAYAAFLQTQDVNQQAWLTSGGPGGGAGLYNIVQVKDSPGGKIKGYELTYQQNLTFLPSFLKDFGVQLNFTKLSSEINYTLDPGAAATATTAARPATYAPGPFLGASPKSANATLYYETSKWSARASMAYRSGYVTTYPIATGACAPGAPTPTGPCSSVLVNDFIGSLATKNYDATFTYNVTDNLTFSLDGLNLSNQTDDRWVYQNDPLVAQYSSPGRQYFAGFRYQY